MKKIASILWCAGIICWIGKVICSLVSNASAALSFWFGAAKKQKNTFSAWISLPQMNELT